MTTAEEIRIRLARVFESERTHARILTLAQHGKYREALNIACANGEPLQRVTVVRFDRARART